MADKRRQGVVLCRPHAYQAAELGQAPTGACDPERWLSGDGREVVCDAVRNPEGVRDFLDRRSRA